MGAVEGFQAARQQLIASRIRKMPPDFAPNIFFTDNQTHLSILAHDGVPIALTVRLTGDKEKDSRSAEFLRHSAWQKLELLRLGIDLERHA